MEGSDGGKGVVDSEEGGQGMVALVEGRSECSPYRISNDDDDNVVVVPASVCVASCHVAEWGTVPLACCVMRGSGDAVCLSFWLVGAGHRLTVVGGVVVVFVIAGGRTHSSGARLLVPTSPASTTRGAPSVSPACHVTPPKPPQTTPSAQNDANDPTTR